MAGAVRLALGRSLRFVHNLSEGIIRSGHSLFTRLARREMVLLDFEGEGSLLSRIVTGEDEKPIHEGYLAGRIAPPTINFFRRSSIANPSVYTGNVVSSAYVRYTLPSMPRLPV